MTRNNIIIYYLFITRLYEFYISLIAKMITQTYDIFCDVFVNEFFSLRLWLDVQVLTDFLQNLFI